MFRRRSARILRAQFGILLNCPRMSRQHAATGTQNECAPQNQLRPKRSNESGQHPFFLEPNTTKYVPCLEREQKRRFSRSSGLQSTGQGKLGSGTAAIFLQSDFPAAEKLVSRRTGDRRSLILNPRYRRDQRLAYELRQEMRPAGLSVSACKLSTKGSLVAT